MNSKDSGGLQLSNVKKALYKILHLNVKKEDVERVMEMETEIKNGSPHLITIQKISKVPFIIKRSKLNILTLTNVSFVTENNEWNPNNWTITDIVRSILLITWSERNEEDFSTTLIQYYNTSDTGLKVSILKSLPFIFQNSQLTVLAQEAIRSNDRGEFEAIAINNLYPAMYFELESWNQMLLKATMLDCPLYLIYDLDRRCNSQLAILLSDYAFQNWKSGKSVTPEICRLIAPFINTYIYKCLLHFYTSGDSNNRNAVLLSCYKSVYLKTQTWFDAHPTILSEIKQNKISWELISNIWYRTKPSSLLYK